MTKSINLNNLELAYKQLYTLSVQIGELLQRELYNDVLPYIEKKDRLLNEADKALKKAKAANEDTDFLKDLAMKIEAQERENLDAFTKARDEIKEELHKVSQDRKIVNAYDNGIGSKGSILDFHE